MKRRSFRVLRERNILHGTVFDVSRDLVEFPNGKRLSREVIRHPGSSVVLPVLPNEHIVLIQQFRYPAGGWIWELPAGTLEPGETPRACAAREIMEEIGYRAGRLRKLTTLYPSPGILTECMHLFLATRLVPEQRERDEDELIRVQTFTKREALAAIKRGKIQDAKTLAGLLYYVSLV